MAKSPAGYAAVGSISPTVEHFIQKAQRQDGWNFYVTLNPTNRSCIKPSKQDISHLSCIGIDIDPTAGQQTLPNKQECSKALSNILAEMTGTSNSHVIIDSGRGLWAWLFVDPLPLETDEERSAADQVIKGFTEALVTQHPELTSFGYVDPSAAELSRLARCPGTINHRNGELSTIELDFLPIQTVAYDIIQHIAVPYIEGITKPQPPTPISGSSIFDIAPHMNLTSRQFVLTGVSLNRHRSLFSSAKNLQELGVGADIAEYMLWSGAGRCAPDLNRSDPGCVRRVVNQVWKRSRTQ